MKHCLVVDDSKVVRKISRGIAESLGFETEEADDGTTAIKLCQQNIPDVILLDWNMPIMTGIDFLRQFRKMEGNEKAKVIFCTTENDIARIQEALGEGADEFVMKPFDKDIIQGKLEQLGLL